VGNICLMKVITACQFATFSIHHTKLMCDEIVKLYHIFHLIRIWFNLHKVLNHWLRVPPWDGFPQPKDVIPRTAWCLNRVLGSQPTPWCEVGVHAQTGVHKMHNGVHWCGTKLI
jgi:hypothetical protein